MLVYRIALRGQPMEYVDADGTHLAAGDVRVFTKGERVMRRVRQEELQAMARVDVDPSVLAPPAPAEEVQPAKAAARGKK